MIGLMVVGVIVGYVLLSKFIVTKVLQEHGLKKANIALAIMILIPTWDVILGYPIYAYLCLTKAGVHIYKTVDNVEGFYVGEKDAQYEPYEPYKGYKYIEYQEVRHQKPTGKYYRSYWVNFWEDTQYSQLCVSPRRDNDEYAKAVKSGHCIVKEEISEGEVSRWEWNYSKNIRKKIVPIVNIFINISVIYDRKNNVNIAESIRYSLDQNWLIGIMNESISSRGAFASCGSAIGMLENTLKPKKGEN